MRFESNEVLVVEKNIEWDYEREKMGGKSLTSQAA